MQQCSWEIMYALVYHKGAEAATWTCPESSVNIDRVVFVMKRGELLEFPHINLCKKLLRHHVLLRFE